MHARPPIKNPSDLDCPVPRLRWCGWWESPLKWVPHTFHAWDSVAWLFPPHKIYLLFLSWRLLENLAGFPTPRGDPSPQAEIVRASQIWAIPKDSTPPSSKFQRLCPPIFRSNHPTSDSPTSRTFCLLIAFCNILFRWPVGQELVNCGEFQSNRAIGLVSRAIRS